MSKLQLFQHFKGDLYVVTSESTMDVTNGRSDGKSFVSYQRLCDGACYVREFEEFHGNVEHEGKTGPRFRYIHDPADIMPNGGHP